MFSLFGVLKGLLIQDTTDRTKQFEVSVSPSATTGTKTTLVAAQTANRTITLPDNSDALVDETSVQTLENKTMDFTAATGNNTLSADAVDIVYDNASSGLTATDVQAALDEVDAKIDAHIADPTAAHAASAISNTPSGAVTATDVQGAINELDSDLTTHINDTSTHGVTGDIVGTTDSQTLTNKTLTSPDINTPDIDGGLATNTSRLLLPKETTTNLDALTDVQAGLAYDTTLNEPVYNTGSGWTQFPGAGSGNVTGQASSVDSEITLFSGTTGKVIKRATGTGFVKATSGVYSTSATVNAATELTGVTPVANGGTGASSLTANNVLLGNGTSAVQVVAPGTSGNVLTSNGTTWTSAAAPSVSADLQYFAAQNFDTMTSISRQWESVTYGNGTFVAVSSNGVGSQAMTSPDGYTWTARSTPVDLEWRSVTFGNSLFVAVAQTGTGNRVMTSPDGITWTSRTSASDTNWQSVIWAGGSINLFVAVADTGTSSQRVMTSPDGITWTNRTSFSRTWQGIAFDGTTLVAVAEDNTVTSVMTSTDGITWTSRTPAATNGWMAVTYGNGLFVAVAQNGTDRIMTSPDGITWTSRTSAGTALWRGITYGNGVYVASSVDTQTNDKFMVSKDGINWVSRPLNSTISIRGITYNGSVFVGVPRSGSATGAISLFY